MKSLIISTRESPLALSQAEWVKNQLSALYPDLEVELLGITTEADKKLSVSLSKIGGKGLFVKELEEALLSGRADMAVHSMKDMPMDYPAGLTVPVICKREDPRDVLVSNQYRSLAELPKGARVGTSSLRRQCQMRALYPDLHLEDLRGNVNTRLSRLDAGEFDALILAAAGLKRLGLEERISAFLSPDELLPAVGQGALALECRTEDKALQELLKPLNDPQTYSCVTAERALCQQLGGGCHVPVAAFAEREDDYIELRALVGAVDGSRILRAHGWGSSKEAKFLGRRVAEDLLQQGAADILSQYL